MMSDTVEAASSIIKLTEFREKTATLTIDQIEAYWLKVKGPRLVPTRTDIDPRALGSALSHLFVLERIAEGLARFRVAGSHLSDLMGTEVRGMPVSAVFDAASRSILSEGLQAVFDDPSIVRLELGAQSGFARAEMIGEMVLLPLRSDLGEVSRVLGGIAMTGNIGRTPRKLVITGQTRRGLTGTGQLDGSRNDSANRIAMPLKDNESSLPSASQRPKSALPPYLRLVWENSVSN